MRKYLLLTLLCGITLSLSAQITITDSDVGPIGEVYVMAYDTLPSVDEGSAGTSQTWDYSGITMHVMDTIGIEDPASTPYAANFPGSNLCVHSLTNESFIYSVLSADSMYAEGIAFDPFQTGTPFIIPMDPVRLTARFPLNYGDSWMTNTAFDFKTEFSLFPGVDSIRSKSISDITANVDAWGSLTTPMGSYDVIRVREIEHTIDSTWGYSFGMWTLFDNGETTDSTFTFWANSVGYLLAEVAYDDMGNLSSVQVMSDQVVAVDEAVSASSIKAWPNPADNVLNLEISDVAAAEVVVLDLQGRELFRAPVNAGQVALDLEGLAPAMYLFRILDDKAAPLHSGRFQVAR